MAREREIACIHYVCEGNCDLGKDAKFRGHCQTCPTYKKKPGGQPARVDTRRKKMERILKKSGFVSVESWSLTLGVCTIYLARKA